MYSVILNRKTLVYILKKLEYNLDLIFKNWSDSRNVGFVIYAKVCMHIQPSYSQLFSSDSIVKLGWRYICILHTTNTKVLSKLLMIIGKSFVGFFYPHLHIEIIDNAGRKTNKAFAYRIYRLFILQCYSYFYTPQ